MKSIKNKIIFTRTGPLIKMEDVLLALRSLLPWRWAHLRSGSDIDIAKNKLKSITGVDNVYLVDSARSGLLVALLSLDLQEGDEVIVQAYTCMVVVSAIVQSGGTPVFVDIDDRYNIDLSTLGQSITARTKAIIIQHTFGVIADVPNISVLAKKYNITTIEDSAHIIGVETSHGQVGTLGDIGVFSFGSEKYISTARGGAVIINNLAYKDAFQNKYDKLKPLVSLKVIQHLTTFPIFFIGRKWYDSIGKYILFLASKLRITARIIYKSEMTGEGASWYPAKFPNALAPILSRQLDTLQENIAHRQIITDRYRTNLDLTSQSMDKDSAVMQFAIELDRPLELHKYLQNLGIFSSDSWFGTVVVPRTVDIGITGYIRGSAPHAEEISVRHLALPTHPNVSLVDADRIVHAVNIYTTQLDKQL
jgi:perosamine synthetase